MKFTIIIPLTIATVCGAYVTAKPPPRSHAIVTAGAHAQPRVTAQPATIPDLCSFDGGRYCDGQGGGPLAKEGGLCCTEGICFEWSGGTCDGILGWCFDYTTSTGPTGIETAQCHD